MKGLVQYTTRIVSLYCTKPWVYNEHGPRIQERVALVRGWYGARHVRRRGWDADMAVDTDTSTSVAADDTYASGAPGADADMAFGTVVGSLRN